MQIQQIKSFENVCQKSNYFWLSRKNKQNLQFLSSQQEYSIRQGFNRVCTILFLLHRSKFLHLQIHEDQKTRILKQLLDWLDNNPNVDYLKVPEMCIYFLNRMDAENALQKVTLSRLNSFRNSLRKISIRSSNRIAPNLISNTEARARRSVTFNDQPIIYSINK